MHFILSEPHIDPVHVPERLVRSYLVSETSELLRWYAQLTGKLWLPWHQLQRKDDAGYIFQLTIFDLECVFEKAFSQWRQLLGDRTYCTVQYDSMYRKVKILLCLISIYVEHISTGITYSKTYRIHSIVVIL